MTAAQVGDAMAIGYLVVAVIACVATWVGNARVYYANGDPPSGVLTGLFWPLVPLACLVMWWCDPMRKEDRHTAGDE